MNTLTLRTQTLRAFVLSAAVLLTGLARSAKADGITYFTSDATINYTLGSVYVGYGSDNDLTHHQNGTSPTVRLVDGGKIGDSNGNGLRAFNHSYIDMSGGQAIHTLWGYDNSTITIRGGTATSVVAKSRFNFLGGYLSNELDIEGNGYGYMSGGSVDHVTMNSNNTFYMQGGVIRDNLWIGGNGQTLLTNGAVIKGKVSLGSKSPYPSPQWHATLYQWGGQINGDLEVACAYTADVRAGQVNGSLYAENLARVTLRGGSVGSHMLFVSEQANITLIGHGIQATLLGNYYTSAVYALSGALSDNTSLSGTYLLVQNGTGASYSINNDY